MTFDRWDKLTEPERDAIMATEMGWRDVQTEAPPARPHGYPPLSGDRTPVPHYHNSWGGFGMLFAFAERMGWDVAMETQHGRVAAHVYTGDGPLGGGFRDRYPTAPLAMARAMWQALGLEES